MYNQQRIVKLHCVIFEILFNTGVTQVPVASIKDRYHSINTRTTDRKPITNNEKYLILTVISLFSLIVLCGQAMGIQCVYIQCHIFGPFDGISRDDRYDSTLWRIKAKNCYLCGRSVVPAKNRTCD